MVSSQLMSKDINGKPAQEFIPTQQPTAAYTSLIEQHAAQLMDELFQDLTPDPEDYTQPSGKTSHPRTQELSSLALRIPLEDESVIEGLVVPFVEMDATLESLFPPIPNEPISHQGSGRICLKNAAGHCLPFVSRLGMPLDRDSVPSICRQPCDRPSSDGSARC